MIVKSMNVPVLEECQKNEPISRQVYGGHPEEELDPDEDGMNGYEADIEDNVDNEEAGPDLEEQRNGAHEIVAVQNFHEISNHILDTHSDLELDPDEEEGTHGHETDMEKEAGPDFEDQRNGAHEIVAVQNSNHILDSHSEVEVDPDEEEGTDGHEIDMEEEDGPDLESQRNVFYKSDDASEDEMDGEIQYLLAMVETFPATVDEL